MSGAVALALAHAAHAAPPQAAPQPATPAQAPPAATPAPAPPSAAPATTPTAAPAASASAAVSAPAAPARPATQREVEQHLSSSDPNAIRQALDDLAKFNNEAAVVAINLRVRRGLWPELTEHAIATLVQMRKASAGPILLELTLHRRPSVRAKAIAALGALNVRSAQSSLLYALDDPSPEVRDAAVSALGVIGTSRALPALFAAAERGAEHAFEAIGAVATSRDLKTILARAQDGDLSRVKPALRAVLARANFPQQSKIAAIDQISRVGTPSARALLVEQLERSKKDGNARMQKALLDAVARLDRAAAASGPAPAPTPATTAAPAASAPPASTPAAIARGGKP
jgi:hypothetical protein